MALSFDFTNKIIIVPQSDCTFVSGTFYTLDTNWLKNEINKELADEDHIWVEDIYVHNTEVGPIAGTTFARTIQIINGWSIQFSPDSQWTVQLEGSNNDIWSVGDGILIQNQVQVIPTNSAGLIVGGTGTGGTDPASVWNHLLDSGNRAQDELVSAVSEAELAKLAAQAADTTAEGAQTAAQAAQTAAGQAKTSADDARLASLNAQTSAASADLAAQAAEAEAEAAKLQAITNATLIQGIVVPTTEITEIWQAHFHRRKWDQTADTVTIYDSDNVTPLHVFDSNGDLSDITPQP